MQEGYVPYSVDELEWPLLLTVQRGDQIELVAMQTLKTKLTATRGSDEAMRCLAEGLAVRQWAGQDIIGICPSIQRLAEDYRRCSGRAGTCRVRMRVFQLTRVIRPLLATGALHQATEDDRQRYSQLLRDFDASIGQSIEEDYLARADRIIGEGRGYLWMDQEAVSMALWTGRTPRGVRIGSVYTPPEFRGRGYASNLVAELSQRLLDEGRTFCFLNTDLANPTSNSIYQKIGYRPVCDTEIWEFATRG